MSTGHDGQRERFYLLRTATFDPCPALSESQLLSEFVTGMRWWTIDELETADAAEIAGTRAACRCASTGVNRSPACVSL